MFIFFSRSKHRRTLLLSAIVALLAGIVYWSVFFVPGSPFTPPLTGSIVDDILVPWDGENDVSFRIITEVGHDELQPIVASRHTILTCPDSDPEAGSAWVSIEDAVGPSLEDVRIYEFSDDYASEKDGTWSGKRFGYGEGQGDRLDVFGRGRTYYVYAPESFSLRCTGPTDPGTTNLPPVLAPLEDAYFAFVGEPFVLSPSATDPEGDSISFFAAMYDPFLDINQDGKVDIGDSIIIDMGIALGEEGINVYPEADLNGDGIISILDMGLFIATVHAQLPEGFTFDQSSGVLSGTPTEDLIGVYAIALSAYNNDLPSERPYTSQAFTLEVLHGSGSSSSDPSDPIFDGAFYDPLEPGEGEGVSIGSVAWSEDPSHSGSQNAADFIGSGYVEFPHSIDLDFDVDDQFTISAWFKNTGTEDQAVIAGKTTTDLLNFRGWQLQVTPENGFAFLLSHTLFNSTLVTTGNAFPLDTWHHVVVQYDGENLSSNAYLRLKMFVNGVEQSLNPVTNNVGRMSFANEASMTVGGDHAGAYVTGLIDEMFVAKGIFSPSELPGGN